MDQRITTILRDLYSAEPALKEHEGILIKMIEALLRDKPETHFDAAFASRLRFSLLQEMGHRSMASAFSWQTFLSSPHMRYATGALVLLFVVVPFAYNNMRNTTLLQGNLVTELTVDEAFGPLSLSSSQSDAVSMGGFVAPSESAPQALGGASRSAFSKGSGEMGSFVDGGAVPYQETADIPGSSARADISVVAPGIPAHMPLSFDEGAVYKFAYEGEPFDLKTMHAKVYKRSATLSASDLVGTLRKMRFVGISFGSLTNLKVDSLTVSEDTEFGYSVTIDFNAGSLFIGQNWQKWDSEGEMSRESVALDDEHIIALASLFLREKGISTASYGAPVVIRDGGNMRIMAESQAGSASSFASGYARVVYPLWLEGISVRDESGNPLGIDVSVDLRRKRVTGVSNIAPARYESSSYPLVSEWNDIVSAIAKHEVYGYNSRGTSAMRGAIRLGAPEVVLTRQYVWTEKAGMELLVPALSFPIVALPEGVQYYSSHLVIPLLRAKDDGVTSPPVSILPVPPSVTR